ATKLSQESLKACARAAQVPVALKIRNAADPLGILRRGLGNNENVAGLGNRGDATSHLLSMHLGALVAAVNLAINLSEFGHDAHRLLSLQQAKSTANALYT